MPDEYIKRSDALKLICTVCQHMCDDSDEFGNGICSIFTSLEGYPAADVEPKRKTGWWVGMKEYCQHLFDTTGERYTMSQLGISLPHCNQCWEENESRTPFCPYCGVKMLHESPKGEDDEGC